MAKILILDDNKNDALEVAEMLSNGNHNTKVICSAENLFDELEQFAPDLLVLEIFLTETDGLTVAKNVKNNSKWKDMPLIVVTNHKTEKKLQDKSLFEEFIPKGTSMAAMVKYVDDVVKKL